MLKGERIRHDLFFTTRWNPIILLLPTSIQNAKLIPTIRTRGIQRRCIHSRPMGKQIPRNTEFQTTSKSLKAICDTTSYPDTYVLSFSSYPRVSRAIPQGLAHIAVLVVIEKENNSFALVSDLAKQSKDPKQISALRDCVEMMDVTIVQLNSSRVEVKSFDVNSLADPSEDVQTWLNASFVSTVLFRCTSVSPSLTIIRWKQTDGNYNIRWTLLKLTV